MPTKEEVEALRAAYNDAERASQDALMAMATAKANVRETKKTATRARIRYHRALGELVADGGEDDGTPENP